MPWVAVQMARKTRNNGRKTTGPKKKHGEKCREKKKKKTAKPSNTAAVEAKMDQSHPWVRNVSGLSKNFDLGPMAVEELLRLTSHW